MWAWVGNYLLDHERLMILSSFSITEMLKEYLNAGFMKKYNGDRPSYEPKILSGGPPGHNLNDYFVPQVYSYVPLKIIVMSTRSPKNLIICTMSCHGASQQLIIR